MPDSVGNVLTLGPTGQISADFTGHLSASAVDLDLTLNGAVVQRENRIQWKRVTDGAFRGGLYATQLFGNDESFMDLYMNSPNGAHTTNFIGHPADSGGMNSRAEVWSDGMGQMLLDAAGGSDFLRGKGFQKYTYGPSGWINSLPGPGGGTPFVATGYKALLINWATGFTTVASGNINVEVYISGVHKGSMFLLANNAVGVHLLLTPLAFVLDTTPGTTYYIWFRIVEGSTANDLGGTIIIQ